MLQLFDIAETSERIRAICLPNEPHFRSASYARTNPFITGWGALSFRKSIYSCTSDNLEE